MQNINEPVPIEYLQEYQTHSAVLEARLPAKALEKSLFVVPWNLHSGFDFNIFFLMSPELPIQALSRRISVHNRLWTEFLVG